MSKDRRLGRGLAALLGGTVPRQAAEEAQREAPESQPDAVVPEPVATEPTPFASEPVTPVAVEPKGDGSMVLLDAALIDENPYQPRQVFNEEEIASLAESLEEHDMLQPIMVRPVGDRYQLISGDRRLRAARKAGWDKVPARVREVDDRMTAELAIVENLQRTDLNPIEKALSFERYIREHDCKSEELAKRLKINRSTVANLLRLLELPDVVKLDVQRGDLSAGHARALLSLGEPQQMVTFAEQIRSQGWSVRETERRVRDAVADSELKNVLPFTQEKGEPVKSQSNHIKSMEKKLKFALGTKVDIRVGAKNKGKIIVHFSNNDEFERLQAFLTENIETESTRKAG